MPKAVRLVFLGTGGGRFVTVSQVLSTGGFRVETDQVFQVDPGPGALRDYRNLHLPFDFSTILLSHDHLDHVHDADVLISAVTDGNRDAWKAGHVIKKVNLIGTRTALDLVHPYFLKRTNSTAVNAGSEIKIGRTKLIFTPGDHSAEEVVGVVFEYGGRRLWYSSDTRILGEHYKLRNLDLAVLNVVYPRPNPHPRYDYHLSAGQVVKWALEARPKTIIIRHFGMRMLKAGPDKVAAGIEKATGVRTIAAKDGMVFELPAKKT